MMSTISHAGSLRWCLFSLILALFSISVHAATPQVFQGPYIGVYTGQAYGNHHLSTDVGTAADANYFANSDDVNAVNQSGTFSKSDNVVIAGFDAGEDWTWNKMVYGVVIDYGALGLGVSKSVNNVTYPNRSDQYSMNTSMNAHWLCTLRGRLGYETFLYWPSLIYATYGVAMTEIEVNNHFNDNSSYEGAGESHRSSNQLGWTLGAGVEFAISHHLSTNFEYSYIDFPSVKSIDHISNMQPGFGIPAQSVSTPFSTTGHFHASLLKIGLKYRF